MKLAALAAALALMPMAAIAQMVGAPASGRPQVGVLRMPSVPATTVEEITVLPRAACLSPKQDPGVPPPKIVDSFPANGAVLRPGLVVVRVTFDKPMSCEGFFFSDPLFPTACPTRRQDLLLSLDRLTIRTVCRLQPSSRYSLMMNQSPENGPDRGAKNLFESLAGWPSPAYEFRFNTSNAAPARTIREALKEDPRPGVARLDDTSEIDADSSRARFSPWAHPPQ